MRKTQPSGGKPDKLIRDSLMMAIRQSPQKLKKAAEKVLDDASEGNLDAMKFMADRIDGKAIQPIAHSVVDEPQDESSLDATIRELANKVGIALSVKEKARADDAGELPSVH